MFRFLESTPPNEVDKLLEKLVESLQSKMMPSFFIEENNLLATIPDGSNEEILTKIKDIRNKPASYLTREIFRAVTLDREGDEFSPVYLGYV